jgi:chromosome segregation ATPase
MAENIDDFGREYGRLVLKELERLNEGQNEMRRDFDRQFKELNEKMSDFKTTEKDVEDLKEWREKVTETWSTTQMQQSKNEIYKQKNQWQKVTGVLIAIQVIWGFILAFKDKLL